jgi:hypothetical protein
MTVIKTSRSSRTAYLVLFLVIAVALTTALVLAAERSFAATNRNSRAFAVQAPTTPGAQDVH